MMISKRHVSSVVALLVLICGATIVHNNLLDGLHGLILRAIAGSEDTHFAPGYSSTSFRAITRGMGADAVLDYLGNPIEKIAVSTSENDKEEWRYRIPDGQYVGWIYSTSPSSSHYRRRIVILHNDQVVDVVTGFYWD